MTGPEELSPRRDYPAVWAPSAGDNGWEWTSAVEDSPEELRSLWLDAVARLEADQPLAISDWAETPNLRRIGACTTDGCAERDESLGFIRDDAQIEVQPILCRLGPGTRTNHMLGPPHPGGSTYALSEVASSSTFDPRAAAQNDAATTASWQSNVTLSMKADIPAIFPHAARRCRDLA